jgi:hypothetical protein
MNNTSVASSASLGRSADDGAGHIKGSSTRPRPATTPAAPAVR